MTHATAFGEPVVARYGADDPHAPLVVLLHGRGSNEQEILTLAAHLPGGVEYAAVRAPIAEGGGDAWFANRAASRALAASSSDQRSHRHAVARGQSPCEPDDRADRLDGMSPDALVQDRFGPNRAAPGRGVRAA